MFFETQLIRTDVTVVKLIENVILIGIGNFLNVYSSDEPFRFIKKCKIFQDQKIYGIEIDSLSLVLLLYGGCYMNISCFNFTPIDIHKLCHKRISDWILTAKWLSSTNVAVVVMSNKVLIFDENLNKQREVVCHDKCILYSAFLHYKQGELVVFSGTVFGEILLWKALPDTGGHPVSAKLKGHKGVIFSVYYNAYNGYICTSSDDRSTILWSVANKCIVTELQQSAPDIAVKHKVYGHQSRVFRSMLSGEWLITAGEDSYINVWNLNGQLVHTIHAHQGSPVWTFICENNVIVSGGGDCGVLLSPLDRRLSQEQIVVPNKEVPKHVTVLHSNNIVVVCEHGSVWHYAVASTEWTKVGHHEDLKSYSLLEVSKCRKLLSLSGYHGTIYIYRERESSLQLFTKCITPAGSRIYSFHWLSCQTFITCQDSMLTLWYLHNSSTCVVYTFILPKIKDIWTTAACQYFGQYIVGDRKGNIYVYGLQSHTPIQVIKKAHSYLGITNLYNFGNRIVSLGRNGVIRTYVVDNGLLVSASNDKVPFTWLTQFVDGWLLAFSSNNFVVWDYAARRSLFEHDCGGGHRSWDFAKTDVMTFAYVKDRVINLLSFEEKTVCPINVVSGYHHKVVNAVKIVKTPRGYLILSGGEDTNLRLSLINEKSCDSLQNFKSHLSSIRSLCLHKIQDGQYLAFSGGGRGQIICWKLFIDFNSVEKTECLQYYSHYEPVDSDMSEIRVMDVQVCQQQKGLLLFVACSDGNIKVYSVGHDLKLVQNLFYQLKCVTRICVIQIDILYLLVATTTNANFIFWDVTDIQRDSNVPLKVVNVHQSGINSCSYRILESDLLVLLSGGDDGTISLNLFKICQSENRITELNKLSSFQNHTCHCAQITGTFLTGNYFLTTSVDQKLLLFNWGLDKNQLNCNLMSRHNTSVADVQGMECEECDDCFNVFLYGKGVEYLKCIKSEKV